MSDLDPFADNAFVTRLQKLMSMIGSAQPAEAEAARKKLLEHLSQHRMSLTDVAIRLGDAPRAAAPYASFTQGAREMQLERQLRIARSARQEAEGEAALSVLRLAELQAILQRANLDMARLLNGQSRMRIMTAASCVVAVICIIGVALPYLPSPTGSHAGLMTLNHEGPVSLQSQATPPRMGIAERIGTAAVQDLAVRLTPNDDAGVRAFLNIGERVLIEQQTHIGQQDWLRIRSETGSGWVRSGDIIH